MSQTEPYDRVPADIPLPRAVHELSELFSAEGATLFVVGGAVRDYLYASYHGSVAGYAPKDVDFATELPPERVEEILRGRAARARGVRVFPKGKAFGVMSALLGGAEYEIATFREEWYDPEGPGRRPEKVWYSTPAKDAQRRDLTVNALFYDIQGREIRDYNLNERGRGQGLEDVRDQVARVVGDPAERFREDKLRVLRLVRFFALYNAGDILPALDERTRAAVAAYRDLAGVSGERVVAEFTTGLKKAKSPPAFLRNLDALGLMPTVFPGLRVSLHEVERVGAHRNLKAVLAWLLRDNDPRQVRTQLNRLKYANEVSDTVSFLLRLYRFDVEEVAALLRARDLYRQLNDERQREEVRQALVQDVTDFGDIAGKRQELERFLAYEPQARSQEFQHLTGKAIGEAMATAEAEAYRRYVAGEGR
jgi:tRNA nucleotidyltransferase/poly(A) polymerase